jgi:hypothetical protein
VVPRSDRILRGINTADTVEGIAGRRRFRHRRDRRQPRFNGTRDAGSGFDGAQEWWLARYPSSATHILRAATDKHRHIFRAYRLPTRLATQSCASRTKERGTEFSIPLLGLPFSGLVNSVSDRHQQNKILGTDYESGGQEFESLRARQSSYKSIAWWVVGSSVRSTH